MYIQQVYTNCLAQAAYYIESNGEAAIIDPLRDYEAYLAMANERGVKIKYIFGAQTLIKYFIKYYDSYYFACAYFLVSPPWN